MSAVGADKNKIRSVVAVPSMDKNTAGAVVWWRLLGTTELSKLAFEWEARGLDPKLLPRPVTPGSALWRAALEFQDKHLLARPCGKKGRDVSMVRETLGDTNTYDTELHVRLNEGSTDLVVTPADHVMAPKLRAAFRNHLEHLSTQDMGAWLAGLTVTMKALSLRDTGGIYFVPRATLPAWQQIEAVVHAVTAHAVFELPALRTEEAVAAILDSLTRTVEAEAQAMDTELADGQLGARALTTRTSKVEGLVTMMAAYEDLLGDKLVVLKDRMEHLRAGLATALLATDEVRE